MQLNGRVALVTGASRGIGRAIAVEFARRGADVVITARALTKATPDMPGTLAETAAEVEALGRSALLVGADLSRTEDVERLAAESLAWQGRVDVLVNNAYFAGRAAYQGLDELDLRSWNRQFAVNVSAPFLLAKALVPGMREAGAGAVVNMTSASALIGVYDVPGIAYGTTKAALSRLSSVLGRNLEKDNVAVFAVDPGFTSSVMVDLTHQETGLDPSLAHSPKVPATLIADLVEADTSFSAGRVFHAVADGDPRLIADVHEPQEQGVPVRLPATPAR